MRDRLDNTHVFLICSVGGTPGPIVASLMNWRPAKVYFVCSPETMSQIQQDILPALQQEGQSLPPGCHETLVLPDSQDLDGCVTRLRDLDPLVASWIARGDAYLVVADLTGGTKCMSAALALQARRWPCLLSYVGGTERTKSGVGVVVSGKETVLHTRNPWEALGFQAVEDALTLFDQGAFAVAASRLQVALERVQSQARKRELLAFKVLAEAYDAWDRFEHAQAVNKLGELSRYGNDLRVLLGTAANVDRLLQTTQKHTVLLEKIRAAQGPTRDLVLDLLANAERRAGEGRYDDAVARLYRAIEALAQVRLRDHYATDTSAVVVSSLPEELQLEWSGAVEQGQLKLGLQNAYCLLAAWDDPLGHRFTELELADRQGSPLVARNSSILAHGFSAVSRKSWASLRKAAMALAELDAGELPRFPRLADILGYK